MASKRIVIEFPPTFTNVAYLFPNWMWTERPIKGKPLEFHAGKVLPPQVARIELGEATYHLVQKLVGIPGVEEVKLSSYQMSIYKYSGYFWWEILPEVKEAIKEAYVKGFRIVGPGLKEKVKLLLHRLSYRL